MCPGQDVVFNCINDTEVNWSVEIGGIPSNGFQFNENSDQLAQNSGSFQAAATVFTNQTTGQVRIISLLRLNPESDPPTDDVTVRCNDFEPHTESQAGQFD